MKIIKYTLILTAITLTVLTVYTLKRASFVTIEIYNSITQKHQDYQQSVAALDVIYQKRHALVKNLLNITKEVKVFEKDLINNEKDILMGTALAKASATKMDVKLPESVKAKIKAEDGLGNLLVNAMDKLMVNAQHYPNISDPKITDRTKTFESLSELRNELKGMEEEIVHAKLVFNAKAADYNSSITLFPGNLVANYFGYTKAEYNKLENSDEKQTPEVTF